jgi:ATP-binding cassette subfamily B protein
MPNSTPPTTAAPTPTPTTATPTPTAPTPQPGLFRAARSRIWIIGVLALISAVVAIVPFIAITELAKTLWPALAGGPIDHARAWYIMIAAAAALVLGFAAAGASGMISHLADNDLQHDIRSRIIAHLRRLPLGWFDQNTSATVKKATENDVAKLHQVIAHSILDFTMGITVPVLSLAYLFWAAPLLALAALLPLVITAVLYAFMLRGGQEKFAQYDAAVERLNQSTIEFVHGIEVVKSYGQAGRSHQRYREETTKYVRFYHEWTRETAIQESLMEIVTSPPVVLAYLAAVSASLIGAGRATPLDCLPVLLLGVGLTAPLLQLASNAHFLRDAMHATTSLKAFLAQPPITYAQDPKHAADAAVNLSDVHFSYDSDHLVLREVCASAAPGTLTALVGVSGSGKSTLARLIPRFYDPTTGVVSLGGEDVRDIGRDELYRQVGFVFQDAHLLRASIRDNIRLTRPHASDQQVEAAARAAQIHDRIMRLPRGYDSVIHEDAHLSGGEAQRLTIARALITDAPVLILDEATAFADPDSEAEIQTALSHLATDRTVVVIAHRLHTITGADQILVLDSGRIVERGRHHDLAHAGGPYQTLWEAYERVWQSQLQPDQPAQAQSTPAHATPAQAVVK